MRWMDVTDEATMPGAPPEAVFDALASDYTGRTNWAAPDITGTVVEAPSGGAEGTVADVTVHHRGKLRFRIHLVELARPSRIRVAYTGGDFIGEGVWTIDPVEGGTRARLRWVVRPGTVLMRVLSWVVNIERAHSEVMQRVFQSLKRHLDARRTEA